ncbi:electron transport complex subunit RsxB [Rubrivivax rivuli]|uniref:Electron transport complex subunit RsxB n=1 Tax=Rubrivivax rivuli TaxID=1862385 RepID=A0A437REN4_9BURK|nr:electron transport complex subunit RsxB [Rubrivivax rivuli]RVU45218.1 electron transport complex subunit RsxB [Rubrivivax rivuli]
MPLPAPAAPLLAPDTAALAERLNAALPQTQCTRCGYPDCRSYAVAMATGEAPINRCPPGGAAGIGRLAQITGGPTLPLDTAHGTEGPRLLAVIDETWCIGCTLCIKACPVDCIVGASKLMHTVIDAQCTGCELCIPVCPVDCISLVPVTGAQTGWQAWSQPQADEARERYEFRQQRLLREQQENDERLAAKARAKLADLAAHSQLTEPAALDAKRAVIEAALRRAAQKRQAATPLPTAPTDEA